ncbi:MAG: cytochrome c [Pseudomonadota bacterium]|jgi:sulfur-oxidizing protein SoxX
MRHRLSAIALFAATLGISAAAIAEPTAPDKVVFKENAVEQSLTGKPGNAENGKKWMINRKLGNCLACHKNEDMKDQLFHGDVGPPLDGTASRWNAAQLRAIIVNPKKVFGDQTVMPAFYRDTGFYRPRKEFVGKSILNAEQVEDVVAYLSTLKDKQ